MGGLVGILTGTDDVPHSIKQTLQTAGAESLVLTEWDAELLAQQSGAESPQFWLVLPGVERPLLCVRQLLHRQPQAMIWLAVHESELAETQTQLTRNPSLLSNVQCVNEQELGGSLREQLQRLTSRRRFRTSIDRINAELSQRQTPENDALRRLLLTERLWTALWQHIPDALIVIDTQHTIQLWNASAERLFGQSETAMQGRQITTVLPAECVPDFSHWQPGRTHQEQQTPLHDRDEKTWYADLVLSPLHDNDGLVYGALLVLRDISDRVQAQRELREKDRLLNGVIENAGSVIYVKRPDGRYALINRLFEELFHVTIDELRDKTDYDIWPAHFAETFRRNDLHVMSTGQSLSIEELAPHPDGLHTYISTKFPIFDDYGRILATAGISTDISEQKLAEQKIQALNTELKHRLLELDERNRELKEKTLQLAEESRYKSEFLANMSHELRTPLNSLLILSEQLASNPHGNLSERQQEYARIINSSGRTLLELISDLLDLAKIESGRMEPRWSTVHIPDLLVGFAQHFGHVARQRSLELKLECASGASTQIVTDQRRLEQILRNLIANAIKFTERGAVILSIDNAAMPQNGEPGLRFAVTDTGIGIPPDKLDQIFEAFLQLDTGLARRYGGTGLGLSIVKELSQLLHGAVAVSSTVGVGSCFTLYLPLRPPRAPSAPVADNVIAEDVVAQDVVAQDRVAPDKTTPDAVMRVSAGHEELAHDQPATLVSEMHWQGKRVLLVDDDGNNRYALQAQLESCGIAVVSCDNGEQALQQLQQDPDFDLVLMDVMMPVCDGLAATRAIRREPGLASLPIAAVTAKLMPADVELCRQAGMNDVLAKPVQFSALSSLLQHWLNRPSMPEN